MTEPNKAARRKIWLVAPPGCGATLWARRFACGCMLWAEHEPAIHAARRAAGLEPLSFDRPRSIPIGPFRAPHHSVSERGMMGSLEHGWRYRPGELHLAHGGVLYLDEAPELSAGVVRRVAMAWRQEKLEHAQGGGRVVVPLWFSLVIHTWACPCGRKNAGAPGLLCTCTPEQIDRYLGPIGPLLEGVERVELTAADGRALARDSEARDGDT